MPNLTKLFNVLTKAKQLPGQYVKNYAGLGPAGNLNPAFEHTPGVLDKTLKSFSPYNLGIKIDNALAGNPLEKAWTGAKMTSNILSTSPVRPALELISPKAVKYSLPITLGATVAAAAPDIYTASQVLPNTVESSLKDIGINDPRILADQRNLIVKAQPKILYQALAPEMLGGDNTAVGKSPYEFIKSLFKNHSNKFKLQDSLPGFRPPKSITQGTTKPPAYYLPGMSRLISGLGLTDLTNNLKDDNVINNIFKDTTLAATENMLRNPSQLKQSPILKTLQNSLNPELLKDPDVKKQLIDSLIAKLKTTPTSITKPKQDIDSNYESLSTGARTNYNPNMITQTKRYPYKPLDMKPINSIGGIK